MNKGPNKKKLVIKSSKQQTADTGRKVVQAVEVRRSAFIDPYRWLIHNEILKRKKLRVHYDGEDVTPKLLEKVALVKFDGISNKDPDVLSKSLINKSKSMLINTESTRKSVAHTLKSSMDEITKISINIVSLEELPFWRKYQTEDKVDDSLKREKKIPQYIQIVLTETDDILLYNKASVTAPKDSEEAIEIEIDNKNYDHLTIGKGKMRRKEDADAQTMGVLYKSREINTVTIETVNIGSYVSNFEMFDTYQDLEKVTTTVNLDGDQKLDITTYKPRGVDQFKYIAESENYLIACMITQRVLAGNIFENEQRRFRNIILPNPLSLNVKYEYIVKLLWTFEIQSVDRRHAVVAIRFCPNNGDILAVAYGVYKFIAVKTKLTGIVAIWSIKNPKNPERLYKYSVPISSIEFSKTFPQLIAIGLRDGSVEVRDISSAFGAAVAISQRSTSPGHAPVKKICWISLGAGEDMEYEPFLAISEDGTVTKYRLTNSPYLIGYQQMKLDRVEGNPEGLIVPVTEFKFVMANRQPLGLGLEVHPIKNDIYFVLTDEGCIHKCSLNYTHQHIELMKAHDGCIFGMEFSPWSPKLFLTCGFDWCIRIWLEGIVEPLIKLSSGIGPIHTAFWSTTHSTVIIGTTRANVEVWDIRRSILKPIRIQELGRSFLTVSRLSNCGRSLAIGNERGNVFLCSFEDMPFAPFFQYRELEAAVFQAIIPFPELTNEVKSLGFWGYENKL